MRSFSVKVSVIVLYVPEVGGGDEASSRVKVAKVRAFTVIPTNLGELIIYQAVGIVKKLCSVIRNARSININLEIIYKYFEY